MTLLEFFRNEKPNTHGQMFFDILSYDDKMFEKKHNFIQWLFPIDTKSNWNWRSPILTNADIVDINNDALALEHINLGTQRFLRFLGYELEGLNVVKAANYQQRINQWVTKNNHNYKRISRFLCFCKMMGGEQYQIAQNFTNNQLAELWTTHKDIIGTDTISHWSSAIGIDILN